MQSSNDPKSWQPADEAWLQFAKDHPGFGVKPTHASWVYFQRT